MELKELVTVLQGGGSLALVVSVFFIMRAAERLTRIEKMLQIILMDWHRRHEFNDETRE